MRGETVCWPGMDTDISISVQIDERIRDRC